MMKSNRFLAALMFASMLLCPAAKAQQGNGSGTAVSGTPINRSTLNSSVTITTGNTFQTVLGSNYGTSTIRSALTIENNNASDNCWITFGKTSGGALITAANAAKGTSILLLPGGSYIRYWPYVPNDEIEATCASNSDTLYVEVQ